MNKLSDAVSHVESGFERASLSFSHAIRAPFSCLDGSEGENITPTAAGEETDNQ